MHSCRKDTLILKYEPDVKFREMADIFIAAFDRPSYQRGFDEEHSPVARGTTVGETVGVKVGETQEKRKRTEGHVSPFFT